MEPFLLDTDFLQNFVDMDLKDELMLTAGSLGLRPMTTTTCCHHEYSDSITQNIKDDINSGTFGIYNDSPYGTFTGSHRGEKSMIAVIRGKEISSAWVGTADKRATKKFIKEAIRTFDHFEFLWVMVQRCSVSLIKAIHAYGAWSSLNKYHEKDFLLFYANQEKRMLNKLGITALLI